MKRIQQLLFIIFLATCITQTMAIEDMILIPEGEFLMGSDEYYYDESPAHKVYLSAYWIDRCEVSNEKFSQFVRESISFESIEGSWFRYSLQGCLDYLQYFENKYKCNYADLADNKISKKTIHQWSSVLFASAEMLQIDRIKLESMNYSELNAMPEILEIIKEQSLLPVRGVAWRDAKAYARWAGKRLPTEAEWEKAARGTNERLYPWGNEWDESRSWDLELITGHPELNSPYGCQGMAGNVWEWVEDWYGETYYSELNDRANNPTGPEGLPNGELPEPYSDSEHLRSEKQGRWSNTRKVIRGGGFGGPELQTRFNYRCSRRLWSNPNYWHADVGFRCAKDI